MKSSETGRQFPRLAPVGDSAITVEFGDRIDEQVNQLVYAFADAVNRAGNPAVVELVPSYRSLLIEYDPVAVSYSELERELRSLAVRTRVAADDRPHGRTIIEIPVAYGGEYGPDLEFVATHAGLPPEEVVRLHSHQPYRVFMLGYAPGFPYLGGMDPRIACPRLETPRTLVLRGSVGIAETQTGIYPNDSPGGWRIIGRSPVRLFDPNADPPALARPGQFVQFVPVDKASYQGILSEVDAGHFSPRVREGAL